MIEIPFLSSLCKKKSKKENEEKHEEKEEQQDGPACALCGKAGANKKFGGQAFHKKCLRKARKMAKGML